MYISTLASFRCSIGSCMFFDRSNLYATGQMLMRPVIFLCNRFNCYVSRQFLCSRSEFCATCRIYATGVFFGDMRTLSRHPLFYSHSGPYSTGSSSRASGKIPQPLDFTFFLLFQRKSLGCPQATFYSNVSVLQVTSPHLRRPGWKLVKQLVEDHLRDVY